jgi:uncharacterized protein
MRLSLLDTPLTVCRLDSGEALPRWFALAPPLSAAVVRARELTLVCPDADVPAGTVAEHGWRALEVEGPLDLSMTGVMAKLSGALARSGVSLFAVSSYDTDVLLVRGEQLSLAVAALRGDGHDVAD